MFYLFTWRTRGIVILFSCYCVSWTYAKNISTSWLVPKGFTCIKLCQLHVMCDSGSACSTSDLNFHLKMKRGLGGGFGFWGGVFCFILRSGCVLMVLLCVSSSFMHWHLLKEVSGLWVFNFVLT